LRQIAACSFHLSVRERWGLPLPRMWCLDLSRPNRSARTGYVVQSTIQTAEGMTSHSRGRCARALQEVVPQKSEGAGNAGCALHPRSRVRRAQKKVHTSIQVQRKHSGIPCAMALRLISRSPRRRIRLVTVAGGLSVHRKPGWVTKTSADLTPATGARTTRFCRTLQHRSSARRKSLTDNRPAIALRAGAAASTASRPNVRDDGRRPSFGTGWQ
jgi:hypothetical protein